MASFLSDLERVCGSEYVITSRTKITPYINHHHGQYKSTCLAVVLPSNPDEVSKIARLCDQYGVALVPQGGNTGTVGGTVANQHQLIVNLKRLNRVLNVDSANFTMSVEAGCVLADIQITARNNDRYFPLSLGSEGSCQIGGNLATNAGGTNVLHYGNTRDLVLGIQVVLADGRILDDLNTLRKNNAGYDLKNLFIGSEGTLGIITATVLKLFPQPSKQIVSLIAVKTVNDGLELLSHLNTATGNCITSFEIMSRICVQTALANVYGQRDPFDSQYPWYILAIADGSSTDSPLTTVVIKTLSNAYLNGKVQNSVIAESLDQRQQIIMLREAVVDAQKFIGESIKHDIAVPLSNVSEFIKQATQAVIEILPAAIIYCFGHLGDGNLHFNVSQPQDLEKDKFLSYRKGINRCVHDIAYRLNGTFSAEHGIGLSKLDELDIYKSKTELETYRKLKNLFDPNNILNPGKVLKREHEE